MERQFQPRSLIKAKNVSQRKNLVARVQGRHAYMHEENGRRHGTSKTHYIVMHHYVFPLFLMGNGDFIFLRVS